MMRYFALRDKDEPAEEVRPMERRDSQPQTEVIERYAANGHLRQIGIAVAIIAAAASVVMTWGVLQYRVDAQAVELTGVRAEVKAVQGMQLVDGRALERVIAEVKSIDTRLGKIEEGMAELLKESRQRSGRRR
jgi:hypothetical protein